MGNLNSHEPWGPNSSDWYPVSDGNYSVWHDGFVQQIQKHCGADYRLKIGRSVRGGGVSESAFGTLFSGTPGAGHLRNAIADQSLGEYVRSKGGNLVLLSFGILGLIVAIVLAFAVMRRGRRCLGKCAPGCGEKQRLPPSEYAGFAGRMLCYKVLAGLSSATLFGLGVAAFVFAADLRRGVNAITCDFWLINYGHFFGAKSISAPAGVITNWKGTADMWDEMKQMSIDVNPTPDGAAGTARCPLCLEVEEAYSGVGGLSDRMLGYNANVSLETNKAILLVETTALAVQQAGLSPGTNAKRDALGEVKILKDETANLQQGDAAAHLFRSFAKDYNSTVQTGLGLFRESIDKYLNRDSAVLQQGYDTAADSVDALNDVNYLMAKILVTWDKELYPLIRGLVTTLVVLTVLSGVWGVCVGLLGLFLLVRFERTSSTESPSPRLTKLLGAAYAGLVIFTGISFLMFTVQMFAGSAGGDACTFVKQNLFEEGDWNAFPPRLLGETVTNRTNMEAVLDTCVKHSGDGDVGGTLGLRILLDKLRRNVDRTSVELNDKVDTTLSLNYRQQKAEALAQVAREVVRLAVIARVTMTVGGIADDAFAGREQRFFDMPQVILNPKMEYSTVRLGLMNLILSDYTVLELMGQLDSLNNVFQPLTTLKERAAAVNEMLATVGHATVKSACSSVLAEVGVCELATDGSTLDVVEGADLDTVVPEILTQAFSVGGVELVERLAQGIFELRAAHVFNNNLLSNTMPGAYNIDNSELANFTAELPGYFEDLVNTDGVPSGLTYDRVLTELVPEWAATCSGAEDPQTCRFRNILDGVDEWLQSLSQMLLDVTDAGSNEVQNFVQNTTLARFYAMIDDADTSLAEFNCQFLGTALDNSVTTGLCSVAMPAVTSIGLVSLVFTLAAAVCAWVAWRAYRYYSDLAALGPATAGPNAAVKHGALPPYTATEEKVVAATPR